MRRPASCKRTSRSSVESASASATTASSAPTSTRRPGSSSSSWAPLSSAAYCAPCVACLTEALPQTAVTTSTAPAPNHRALRRRSGRPLPAAIAASASTLTVSTTPCSGTCTGSVRPVKSYTRFGRTSTVPRAPVSRLIAAHGATNRLSSARSANAVRVARAKTLSFTRLSYVKVRCRLPRCSEQSRAKTSQLTPLLSWATIGRVVKRTRKLPR